MGMRKDDVQERSLARPASEALGLGSWRGGQLIARLIVPRLLEKNSNIVLGTKHAECAAGQVTPRRNPGERRAKHKHNKNNNINMLSLKETNKHN